MSNGDKVVSKSYHFNIDCYGQLQQMSHTVTFRNGLSVVKMSIGGEDGSKSSDNSIPVMGIPFVIFVGATIPEPDVNVQEITSSPT
jgi:hypothetical protein